MRKITPRILLFVLLCVWIPLCGQADDTIESLAGEILLSGDAPMYASVTVTEAAATAAPTKEPLDSAFRFSVLPVLPENQDPTITAYYSLTVTPGQEQTLQVEVTNDGYEPITVMMSSTRAMTNENGLIQYAATDAPADASLQADIAEFVSFADTKLQLQGQETQTVPVTLSIPETPFDGTLLGGLVFVREQDEAEMTGSGGVILGSQYSYVVPIRLRSANASTGTMAPTFELVSIEPNMLTVFGHRTIVTVRNPQPLIVKPLTLTYTLYTEGDDQTPVATYTGEGIEMAPNTQMGYRINQEEALAPGRYTAQVSIAYLDQTYDFSETFTVQEQ